MDTDTADRIFWTDEAGESTWAEMAEANDPETMDTLATLEIGDEAVFGMCDIVRRIA